MAETTISKSVLALAPRRNPAFIWRKMGIEAVLFNPATNETYLLNPTAAAIWELCDGAHRKIMEDRDEYITDGLGGSNNR